jgi:hypothetical protein
VAVVKCRDGIRVKFTTAITFLHSPEKKNVIPMYQCLKYTVNDRLKNIIPYSDRFGYFFGPIYTCIKYTEGECNDFCIV